MTKYPNQRTVEINKPESFTKNFAIYGKDEMATACKVLNGSAFKVWCYLLSNKKQESWNISPAHAQEVWGISRSSFSDGLNELIKKGYYDPKEQIIYHSTTKDINEIRKQKRKQTNVEIREDEDTRFGSIGSEKEMSNNISDENIVDAEASTKNINKVDSCASTRTAYEKETKAKRGWDFSLFVPDGEFRF